MEDQLTTFFSTVCCKSIINLSELPKKFGKLTKKNLAELSKKLNELTDFFFFGWVILIPFYRGERVSLECKPFHSSHAFIDIDWEEFVNLKMSSLRYLFGIAKTTTEPILIKTIKRNFFLKLFICNSPYTSI